MEAARSQVASEAARARGQKEDELMSEEDEAHQDPLGQEVEDILEAGHHLVVVGPRLGWGEGVADQEDDKVADGKPLEDTRNPES